MAPAKQAITAALKPLLRKTRETRSKVNEDRMLENEEEPQLGKRKSDNSPTKTGSKRAALVNLTNAVEEETENPAQTATDVINAKPPTETFIFMAPESKRLLLEPARASTRQATVTSSWPADSTAESKFAGLTLAPPAIETNVSSASSTDLQTISQAKRRISTDFNKSEDSLYVSALEDISCSQSLPRLIEVDSPNDNEANVRPDGVNDFDATTANNICNVSEYAHDIFLYLKRRESVYYIGDYLKRHPHITASMRSVVVDWMVAIQESFELNHETFYLGLKILDTFLTARTIEKKELQLVAAASVLLASKYDERHPATPADFVHVCDGAFDRTQIKKMEKTVLKTINYDLGFPLSYRFLRRYARVNQVSMTVLTLARYMLEYSMMDYSTVQLRDSKLACAVLFLAMRMFKMPGWNNTLEYYTGYKIADFAEIAIQINNIMLRKPKDGLATVRAKYSSELFFEVTKIPLIANLDSLFDTTDYKPEVKIPAQLPTTNTSS